MKFMPEVNDERSKMITNSRERDFQAKQEGDTNYTKFPKISTSTSRQWAGFRNPRIVRVSRSFGGKDRHSKVCTIRGLRDRRIRLSVPTAIELYDLQDRLGLSQPSKVVDWLIDATTHEIDKLPPLQMPPAGNFSQFHQNISQESSAPQSSLSPFFNPNLEFMKDGGSQPFLSSKEGIKIADQIDGEGQKMTEKSKYWVSDAREKCKGVEGVNVALKSQWNINSTNQQENYQGGFNAQMSAQNFFPVAGQPSFPGLLNNTIPYNSYYHWDPSNLSLSQFGNQQLFPMINTPQTEDAQNSTTTSSHSSSLPISSSMALPSPSQLIFCPSGTTPVSLFPPYPPYMATSSVDAEPRQINHVQFLNSTSLLPSLHLYTSPMKSFPMNVNPKVVHPPQDNDQSQSHKGNNGS